MIKILKFITKRILQAIPLLLVISLIGFFLMYISPYDAIDAITTPNMTRETVELLKIKYGLDKPFIVQYFNWLKSFLSGDFGYSIVTHSSIGKDLAARIPQTVKLVLPSYITAFILSIILGLTAGRFKNKLPDRIIDGFASLGLSLPTFWFALLLMYFLAYKLKILPILSTVGNGSEGGFLNNLKQLVMPYTVLVVGFMPDLIKYVRSSASSELKEDYVMVQRAFGSSESTILFRHVIKNVLLPVITKLGMALPMLVTGAVITESIFAWPGIGPYYVKALRGMDYPVVMVILVLSSSLVIIGNLLSDVLYYMTDPRIK